MKFRRFAGKAGVCGTCAVNCITPGGNIYPHSVAPANGQPLDVCRRTVIPSGRLAISQLTENVMNSCRPAAFARGMLSLVVIALASTDVAAAVFQPSYRMPSTRSVVTTPTYPIALGPRVLPFEPAYLIPRSIVFADFDGDGDLDIFLAPSFPQHPPHLPVEIWLNRGDGTFFNGTAQVIEGAPPLTWGATQLLVGDFNEDGRPDVFVISSGAEFAVADGLSESGYHNTLLLSQPNGRYRDTTSQIASNAPAFNHQGGMGDANGDGHLDVVLYAGGTSRVDSRGVKLLYGDGKGNFSDATNALPPEIRHVLWSDRIANRAVYGLGYQDGGCATLADLDGDGPAEVITGSYSWPDTAPDGTKGSRTVRFHKHAADGNFVERGRASIPEAIAAIPYGYDPPPSEFAGLGCSEIAAGDLNGDGRVDLIVQWEGAGKFYAQVLRNDGDFRFTDVTLDAFGSYAEGFPNGNSMMGPAKHLLVDVNGDGTLDILHQLGGTELGSMLPHLARLNDGTGRFTAWAPQGASGALTPAEILSAAQCENCQYLPLVFDTNRSGIASLVLMDYQSSVSATTPSQTTGVYLTTFTPNGTASSRAANRTALWWNPAESGWGVNINHQGNTLFATLFTYDAAGAPLWLVMSAGNLQADGVTYRGDLYRTTGPAFDAQPFTPITAANLTRVGAMSVSFAGASAAALAYSVNGVAVAKSIQQQVYGTQAANCEPTAAANRSALVNYQDLWWNPAESGWGVNVTHQSNVLFATLFTYEASGKALWLVMSSGARQADGSYLGDLYRTTGPAFNTQPFTPIGPANLAKVGAMRLSFSDGQTGTLSYSVNGASVTKTITRQVYSAPVPGCQ